MSKPEATAILSLTEQLEQMLALAESNTLKFSNYESEQLRLLHAAIEARLKPHRHEHVVNEAETARFKKLKLLIKTELTARGAHTLTESHTAPLGRLPKGVRHMLIERGIAA